MQRAVPCSRKRVENYTSLADPFPLLSTDAILWVVGKCMYKLEPVVADRGELIIHAPHLREISLTHDRPIEQVGYHVRDYFTQQWERFRHIP